MPSPEVLLPKVEVSVAMPVAVALALRTKVRPSVTEATTAPAGMPVPVIAMPGASPAVLPTVTIGLPLVVAAPASSWVPVRFATAVPFTRPPTAAWLV